MRAVVAVPNTSFSASIASRGGSRGWLETRATRMIAGKLVLLRINSIGGVRRFAGKRGEDWEWTEGRGSPDSGGIERRRRRFCGVPTSYSLDLG
jgi:hypothetical protein